MQFMEELIKNFQHKNSLLQGFLLCSESFFLELNAGSFEKVTTFEQDRNISVFHLSLVDKKIGSLIAMIPPAEKTPVLIEKIAQLVQDGQETLNKIRALDTQIIHTITTERDRLKKLVSDSDRSIQLVKKFKSAWLPKAGEKLDGKL
jgi:hypothetical protein